MPQDSKPHLTARAFDLVGTRPLRPDGLDKVTGRARYGADMFAAGMLCGRILRSPHAHARIKSIDASQAEKLEGVKAVVTSADLPDLSGGDEELHVVLNNVMARGKALYDGHAVAAVAATSPKIANKALKLIKVEYEVLPHVTDVEAAMAPGAPVIHDDLFTGGVEPKPTKPSNVARRYRFGRGDLDKGFKEAAAVVERTFRVAASHQGYIEPHACVANLRSDGTGEMWVCTQGHFMVRSTCAALLGLDSSKLRVTASEIGGGFGGKTTVFIEPVALALSRKAGRPVKVVMSREEVFRATGPTASAVVRVKMGVAKDGRLIAAEAEMSFQGGCYPGSLVQLGAMSAFACYDCANINVIGWDVVTNRPKLAAYRAPSAPIAAFAVESVVDELCEKIGIDKIEMRLKNAAHEGTKMVFGPTCRRIGLKETLEAARNHPHYKAPLKPGQGRGVACGFWFNFGGNTSVSMSVNADGTVNLMTGMPDIGGSRASMALMAAEELGIPYSNINPIIADTSSLGFSDMTDGSRVTFTAGLATINAARDAIDKMCGRAAATWGIPKEAVVWEKGHAKPAGDNAGKFPPLSLKDIAAKFGKTGGPDRGPLRGLR